MLDKITQVSVHLRNRERVALKIQALINDGKLEVLFVSDLDQLLKTLVEFVSTLPAHNKTSNPSRLCPLNMLSHHIQVTARITPQQRIIYLGAIPRLGIKPDI